VGVLAHSAKTLGGGLEELRKTLATNGISDPMWCEVPKSRFVLEQVEKLLKEGVELIFVWGGDGTVQRVIDAVAGVPVALAILPAGTANLFATNLGIPKDLEEAVKIGLNGDQRQLDVGLINREHFGVMAGTGLDALMIRDADAGLKDKVGRFAYVWTGAKNVRKASVKMHIEVDGTAWFKGKASCLLIGNVGDVIGGISVFPDAQPDDGLLNLGVVTASGAMDWVRTLGRSVIGDAEGVPFRGDDDRADVRYPVGQGRPLRDRRGRSEEDQTTEVQGGAGSDHRSCTSGGGAMSTANQVPETWGLTGDDARQTLERTGRWRLIRDAFMRLRYADGFSHARSMAWATTLVFFEGVIAFVGLASALGTGGLSDLIVKTLRQIFPGPAGMILTDAVQQAHKAGSSHRYLALSVGLVNRMYGIEQDRPTAQKYGRAFVLSISVGTLFVAAFAALALGRSISSSLSGDTASTVWNVVRWPLALGLLIAAIALLFKWSPRRRQPGWSWLAFGAIVSVILLTIVTVGLDAMFQISSTFGKTYGPLAGIVALLLWALLASIALLFGGAIGAQLEAVRAGRPAPQSAQKVTGSEPEVAHQMADGDQNR
jgi:diacylglycerol kinase (ATP)